MKNKDLHISLIICILSFALCSSASSQISGKVIYQGHWPLTQYRIIEGEGELIFSNTQSKILPIGSYKNLYFNESNSKPLEENDNPNYFEEYNIHHGDTSNMDYLSVRDPFNIFVNLEKGVLYHKVQIKEQRIEIPANSLIFISESTRIIKWILHPDHKLVGNYNCQKATTYFRGRDYTVWFTPEIPISFGPWKLNGLPGLILEAYDSDHEVFFQATNVKIENDSKNEVLLNPKTSIYEVYPIEKYQKMLWNKYRKIEKKST